MKTKIILSTLLSFYFYLLSSQVPQGFNYQAVAHNSAGAPIMNTTIQVKMGILSDTITPVVVWEELHSAVKTNAYGVFNLVIGTGTRQAVSALVFSDIDWTKTPLFLKVQIYYQGAWKYMGSSRLWTVPYAMVTNDVGAPLKKLRVTGETDNLEEALFEVKNKDSQTVFAVYNEGVRVYVDDGDMKGVKGGFAIGGFGNTKSPGEEYLRVTRDSTRIYINDLKTKGVKGGFAIGGFGTVKDRLGHYFDVSTDTSRIVNPSQNRILWYPLKNAFLAGRVLIEKPDSVGVNSFATGYESKAKGQFSQALGFKAIARGDFATAIGKKAIANNINSFAFGDNAKALSQDSYAFGAFSEAKGLGSFAFGYVGRDSLGPTGKNTLASGNYSFAFGLGCQATGESAFAFGADNEATNNFSMAFGVSTKSSGWNSTTFGYHTQALAWVDMAIGAETVASGHHSFAGGYGSKAISFQSFAFGWYTLASAGSSVAMGAFTKATGFNSFSMGQFSEANGESSTALGYQTVANGWGSLAGGTRCNATDYNSFSFGIEATASGAQSVAMGQRTIAFGDASLALGDSAIANGFCSIALGYRTLAYGNASFAMGRYTKGTGDFSVALGDSTVASGSISIALGYRTLADNYVAMATGFETVSSGQYSFTGGYRSKATSFQSFAFGWNTLASGGSSVAMGNNTKATNFTSFAMGNLSRANASASTSIGWDTRANSFAAVVLGRYNDTINMTNPTWFNPTDPAFVIGNGNSNTDRKNAFTVLQNSNVGINMVTPQEKFDIAGGNGRVESGYNWLTDSDIRFKKNIATIENPLEKVLAMRGVSFDLTNETPDNGTERKNIGFIAQELESVIPEVVVNGSDGYKSVAYDKLTAVLTEAIKEQQKQIEIQQKEIDDLKILVNSLMADKPEQGNN